MRTTEKQLNDLVKQICNLTGLSNNRKQAIERNHDKFIALENSSIYGGWRLINVGVNNGAHYSVFNFGSTDARIKASEMKTKLNGIIAGLEYKKG